MFEKRGNWKAALYTRRPRFLEAGLRPLPAFSPQRAKASGLDTAATLVKDGSCTQSSVLREVGDDTYSSASRTVVLAALSANVLAMRVKPVSAAHETLRHALGTRDAYRIFCAVLREQQASIDSSCGELEGLLMNLEGEAESLAAVACSCVAVAMSPSDWPPWVSARFVATGAAAVPFVFNQAPAGAGKAVVAGEALKEMKDVSATASPLRITAAEVLSRIAARLPSQGACRSASSPSLLFLKWLTLLCGVTMAHASKVALRLAAEVSRVSLDAAGVALAAFCASHTLTAVRSNDDSAVVTVGHTKEAWWLSLWMQLTQPSTQPPLLPPFSLDAVIASPAVCVWSDGLTPADLRERRISWHLHCLVASKEVSSAARLLAGACGDTSRARQGKAELDVWTDQGASIPVLASTQAELLTALPPHLLEEGGLGEELTKSLVRHLRRVQPQPKPPAQRPWSGVPHSLSFVPTVTANAVLYARMLQYLLTSTTHVRTGDSYVRYLHDLSLLLSQGSIYALAASLVPAGQPLKTVMVATKDTHREGHTQQLIGALREVVDSLCGEPISRLAASPIADHPLTEDGVDFTQKPLLPGSAPSSDGTAPLEGEGERKVARRKERQTLVEGATAHPRDAMSWRWREDVLSNVDGAVQAAVRLLTSLLQLCSSRKDSLPLRAAKPKWRQELHERTAVRAHKYELLLQELPHTELRAVLQTLLGHGYIREGSLLGVSLVRCEQVDLRYYTLPLLGSLYLAVSSPLFASTPAHAACVRTSPPSSSSATSFTDAESSAESERQAVYRMYRRRLQIYGNADLNVTIPSYPPTTDFHTPSGGEGEHRDGAAAPTRSDSDCPAAATTTALVRTPENRLVQALALASTRPATSLAGYSRAEFANCLLNRRVDAPGRGIVVDVGSAGIFHDYAGGGGTGGVFGPWHRTGVVTW
ncbi:hypothetical protein JKF63_01192 [Porcisia hertigi]|uniref:Uncharacterized protein n=1 Tax=Porcisia hertigi TaxID=2761500 RepID=A0A836IDY9_9TRYP|nr:hypothetical protein JKF63_01192 [Porcisia hertigi]